MQVDYVFLPLCKVVKKNDRKDVRVKRTVQELKTGLKLIFYEEC